MVLVIYIILGCFLESLSMLPLTVPILCPIMRDLGVDLVWFGILVVVVTETALITPPIEFNIFVRRSVQPGIPLPAVFCGVLPFIAVYFVRMIVLAVFPSVSLLLLRMTG